MSPWINQFLAIFTATMTALTLAGGIAFKFLGLLLSNKIQEANQRQTEILEKKYMLSNSATVTGSEIQRILAEFKSELTELEQREKRHADHNAEMLQSLTTEVAVMKVIALPRPDAK
ncbi:MAG TPA: hypothetical protein VNX68_01620 [Nitrosopumilaceae archaeon]|jgi:hypothetical protein|nr:hypothetical protein [Nitrosopumilaceae archaeon]